MTKSEWERSSDPAAMTRWLSRDDTSHRQNQPVGISERKLRLLYCACARLVWPQLTDKRSRHAVEVAESYADEEATEKDVLHAFDNAPSVGSREYPRWGWMDLAWSTCAIKAWHTDTVDWFRNDDRPKDHDAEFAAIFRDVVGSPWCPVDYWKCCPRKTCHGGVIMTNATGTRRCPDCKGRGKMPPSWFNPTVVALAQAAYTERPGRKCEQCGGIGSIDSKNYHGGWDTDGCGLCHGTGRVENAILDPDQLAVLADALIDAGVPETEESPCPRCSVYANEPCPRCDGKGFLGGTAPGQHGWIGSPECPTCNGCKKFPPGYHPERDPASGRHEGGWTNCKTCNGGGRGGCVRPGVVRVPHPLLTHLRSPGPHWRGMWSLDLLLGKT